MKHQWERLEAWLKANNAALLGDLNPPASDANIQTLEQKIGVKLPADFVECLKVHDGQRGRAGSLFSKGRYLSLDQILSEWTVWQDLLEQGEFDDRSSAPDREIRGGWWRTGWIPFVSNGRGDHLCLDLDPSLSGSFGQVIEISHDFESRCLVSGRFGQWFGGEVESKCHG